MTQRFLRCTDQTHRRIIITLLLLSVITRSLLDAGQLQAAPPTIVGIAGDRFTLNGSPTFLLGVSYFDARFWRVSDLDGLQQRGFNLIRIWLDWRDQSFFDRNGALAPQHRQTLLALVDAAAARGMVVEVAILDTDVSFGKATSVAAVRAAGTALKERTNVLYDLVNEHDHAGDTFSTRQIAQLAQTLRAVDPDAIFMVSSTERHLIDERLNLREGNIKDDVASPVSAPVLAPHLPRTSAWYRDTSKRIAALKGYLRAIGRDVPVYLNEEARRGHSGLNPSVEQFVQAAREARAAGAAAWLFHTDAGFALNDQSFFASLDSVERRVVDTLAVALGNISYTPPAPTTPRPNGNAGIARINAGGEALTVSGQYWSADTGYSGGNRFATREPISGTEADALYQSERVARTFGYQIPVPASASYQVRLHFAEIFWTRPGQRVFDVNLEGGPLELDNFDIVAAAGPRTAVVKTFTVPVSDGTLTIDFRQAGPDRPKISAIEVLITSASANEPAFSGATTGDKQRKASAPVIHDNEPAFSGATTGDKQRKASAPVIHAVVGISHPAQDHHDAGAVES